MWWLNIWIGLTLGSEIAESPEFIEYRAKLAAVQKTLVTAHKQNPRCTLALLGNSESNIVLGTNMNLLRRLLDGGSTFAHGVQKFIDSIFAAERGLYNTQGSPVLQFTSDLTFHFIDVFQQGIRRCLDVDDDYLTSNGRAEIRLGPNSPVENFTFSECNRTHVKISATLSFHAIYAQLTIYKYGMMYPNLQVQEEDVFQRSNMGTNEEIPEIQWVPRDNKSPSTVTWLIKDRLQTLVGRLLVLEVNKNSPPATRYYGYIMRTVGIKTGRPRRQVLHGHRHQHHHQQWSNQTTVGQDEFKSHNKNRKHPKW